MDNPADKIYILFNLNLGPVGRIKAFDRIWKIYSARIAFYISQIIPEGNISTDDCFQEVMLKIYQGLHNFKAEYPLKPWIYAIARNHALDFKSRKEPVSIEYSETIVLSDDFSPESELLRSEIFEAVEKSLKKLSAEDSQIAYLRFHEGIKIKDIAVIMEMNINTVKTRITSVKKNLQNDLRGWL